MSIQVQNVDWKHLAWPVGWSISECDDMAFIVAPDGGIALLNSDFAKAAIEAGMTAKEPANGRDR